MKWKQRLTLTTALLVILALACNLSPQPSQPAADPGAVDTMVAQTVAAQIGQNPPTVDPSDDTPDDSQQPSTQEPPTADSTATFTPEPSATATPTETQAPPPSAVSELNLGSPDASYSFDKVGTFFTYSGADSKVEIKDGKLQFTIFDPIGWTIWSFSALELKDYYFEINVSMPGDCVGKDRGGIIFGTKPGDTGDGINYQVSCDGDYRLFIYDGADTIHLVPWTEDNLINSGPNATNRLGVLHEGNKITLYMNGSKLTTVTDDTYVGTGRIGINMGVDDHDNVTIFFDDAAYWTSIP
ncbi:MAG: hypothetical protein JW757_12540 [Anaerolineales bacterium]|nr:hypothetical protein [Anaerolineales bacterium]